MRNLIPVAQGLALGLIVTCAFAGGQPPPEPPGPGTPQNEFGRCELLAGEVCDDLCKSAICNSSCNDCYPIVNPEEPADPA